MLDGTFSPIANRARPCTALAACLIPLLAVGCQHKALAQREHEERLTQLDWTVETCRRSEQARPERLARTCRDVEWYFANQAVEFERNAAGAQSYFERDCTRAGPRLRRAGERTRELLYGKPENIEETAIILFF